MTDLTDAFGCDDIRTQAARVRALARALLADVHLADDVSQQFLLGQITAPHRRNGAAQPGWVAGALRHLASKAWRSDERRRRREQAGRSPETSVCPAEAMQKAETLQRVVTAAMALDEPYRSTILMRYLEDRSVDEVARAMGVPSSTVRVRSKRGLEKLRERLRSDLGAAFAVVLHRFTEAPPPAAVASSGPSDVAPSTYLQGTTSMKPLLLSAAAVGVASVTTVALLWNRDAHPAGPVGPAEDTGVTWAAGEGAARERADSAGARRPVVREVSEGTAAEAPGPVLRGHVLDNRGRPVGGAKVEAFERGVGAATAPAVAEATTDAAGVFSLEGPNAHGDRDLAVTADGHAAVLQRASLESSRVTLHPAAVLLGTVRDEQTGRALAGITVRTKGLDRRVGSLRPWIEASTDAEGAFRLVGVPAEKRVALHLARPGGVPQVTTVNLQARVENQRTISLGSGTAMELLVVDADQGHAIPDARVFAKRLASELVGQTDAYGKLGVMVPPRAPEGVFDAGLRFEVHAAGYATTVRRMSGATAEMRVPMVPTGRIEGVVRDGTGKAVAGAKVSWEDQPLLFLRERGDGTEPRGFVGVATVGADSRETVTDSTGAFTLPHVVAAVEGALMQRGRLRVVSGARSVTLGDVLPEEPGETRQLEVSLAAGVELAGRALVNGEGAPAWIQLEGEGVQRSGQANPNGTFSFRDLAPGTYQVSAVAARAPARAAPVVVQVEADVRDVELSMSGDFAELRGRVLRQDGSPATGLMVRAILDERGASTSDAAESFEIGLGGGVVKSKPEVAAEPSVPAGLFADASAGATVAEDGSFSILVAASDSDARYELTVFDGTFTASKNGVEPGEEALLTVPAFLPVRFEIPGATTETRISGHWAQEATGQRFTLGPMETQLASDGIMMLRLPVGQVRLVLDGAGLEKALELQVPAAGFVSALRLGLEGR